MAQAGCVVYVGNSGAAAVKYGLVRPEDRSDMAQAVRKGGDGGSEDAPVSLPSAKTRPVHSDKLMRRLTGVRSGESCEWRLFRSQWDRLNTRSWPGTR